MSFLASLAVASIGAAVLLAAFISLLSPRAAGKFLTQIGVFAVGLWLGMMLLKTLCFGAARGSAAKTFLSFLIVSGVAYLIREARRKRTHAAGPGPKAIERIPLVPSHSEDENYENNAADSRHRRA